MDRRGPPLRRRWKALPPPAQPQLALGIASAGTIIGAGLWLGGPD